MKFRVQMVSQSICACQLFILSILGTQYTLGECTSSQPTTMPTGQPSRQPSGKPSGQPSGQPSSTPTLHPNVIGYSPAFISTTLAGSGSAGGSDGTGLYAQFTSPYGICADPDLNYLYATDVGNGYIRKISSASAAVTRISAGEFSLCFVAMFFVMTIVSFLI